VEKRSVKLSHIELLCIGTHQDPVRATLPGVPRRPRSTRTRRTAGVQRPCVVSWFLRVTYSGSWSVPCGFSSLANARTTILHWPVSRRTSPPFPPHVVASYHAPYRDSVTLARTKHSHHDVPGYKTMSCFSSACLCHRGLHCHCPVEFLPQLAA
jgi:hypothetical protein